MNDTASKKNEMTFSFSIGYDDILRGIHNVKYPVREAQKGRSPTVEGINFTFPEDNYIQLTSCDGQRGATEKILLSYISQMPNVSFTLKSSEIDSLEDDIRKSYKKYYEVVFRIKINQHENILLLQAENEWLRYECLSPHLPYPAVIYSLFRYVYKSNYIKVEPQLLYNAINFICTNDRKYGYISFNGKGKDLLQVTGGGAFSINYKRQAVFPGIHTIESQIKIKMEHLKQALKAFTKNNIKEITLKYKDNLSPILINSMEYKHTCVLMPIP